MEGVTEPRIADKGKPITAIFAPASARPNWFFYRTTGIERFL